MYRPLMALAFAAALSPATGRATVIYYVNFSGPNANGPGDVSLTGSIAVRGFGAVTQQDILDTQLTLKSARNPDRVASGPNGISLNPFATLQADAYGLYVSLPGVFSRLFVPGGFFFNNGDFARLTLENAGPPPAPVDRTVIQLNSGGPGPPIFPIIPTLVGVAPEPSTAALAGAGLVTLAGLAWQRTRRPAGRPDPPR